MQAKDGFQDKLYAYNERRRVSLKFSLAEFVNFLFGSGVVIVSFKPKIPKNYYAICSTSESNKQNPREQTLVIPSSFVIRTTSLRCHLLLAQGESLPYWFRSNFAAVFVLIYWLREFCLSAVVNRFEMRCQLK